MTIELGERITWTKPNGDKVQGRVTGIRESGTVMETARGDFHGIQYQIDGSVWTLTFADPSRPIPREHA